MIRLKIWCPSHNRMLRFEHEGPFLGGTTAAVDLFKEGKSDLWEADLTTAYCPEQDDECANTWEVEAV